jgi:hypothetical protein
VVAIKKFLTSFIKSVSIICFLHCGTINFALLSGRNFIIPFTECALLALPLARLYKDNFNGENVAFEVSLDGQMIDPNSILCSSIDTEVSLTIIQANPLHEIYDTMTRKILFSDTLSEIIFQEKGKRVKIYLCGIECCRDEPIHFPDPLYTYIDSDIKA